MVNLRENVHNRAFYKVKLSQIVSIYSLNVADYGFGCLWQFKGRKRVTKWNLGLSQEYVKFCILSCDYDWNYFRK